MYALIDEDQVFGIKELLDQKGFFQQLATVLGNTKCVIGLGCDEPDLRVKKWLENQPTVVVPVEFDKRRQYEIIRIQSPQACVSYFDATRIRLRALSDFATTVDSPESLCDHLIGFSGRKAIFSFHDAFSGGALLISSTIPIENIKAFSLALGVDFKLIGNPQWRPGRNIHGGALEDSF